MEKHKDIKSKASFNRAAQSLVDEVRGKETVSREAVLASWEQVEAKLTHGRRHLLLQRRVIFSVAACVVILLAVGIGFKRYGQTEGGLSLSLLEEEPLLAENEVVLVGQNNRMQLKDGSSLTYDEKGALTLDEEMVDKVSGSEAETETAEGKQAVNQIIVPKGRKAEVTFSDGTRMQVNAGSRVIYPVVFGKDKREIIVEGEVYLEVRKDPSRPFYVKTRDLEVSVLGTKFNVCAYKEDAAASVVLVEGKVQVETAAKEKAVLQPNQLITVGEAGTQIKEVDVYEYICWTENIMLLNGSKAGEVFDRLSRRYGRRILYDNAIKEIPVDGKLDLKERPEDVVRNLCLSLYLTYDVGENGDIIVSKT